MLTATDQDMFRHSFWQSSFHSRTLVQATLASISRIFVEIGMLWLFHIFCSDAPIACPLFNLAASDFSSRPVDVRRGRGTCWWSSRSRRCSRWRRRVVAERRRRVRWPCRPSHAAVVPPRVTTPAAGRSCHTEPPAARTQQQQPRGPIYQISHDLS